MNTGVLDEIEGTVKGHRDGHGFVVRDDGEPDIYLPPNEMRAVLHKDRVKVRVARLDRKGRPEGRVLEITERSTQAIIGRILQEGGIWLVAPEDKRYGLDVLIPKTATGSAVPGQVVVVELTEPPSLYGQPVGRVKEVLGDIDDPGMEIEIAVRKFSVPHAFSDPCMAMARSLPDRVHPSDKRHRVDLTDVPLVTIDGEDARDFDDAVYCEPISTGRGKSRVNGWRLIVAIADVSHYVETGSAIDVDAYSRATSVYFPRRVLPMLPEKLSNGLCSLNPEAERLCMVCDMLVSASGEVTGYQFYPAVMWSHARLTYTEAAAIMANTRGPEAAKHKDRVDDLLHLHEVYRALSSARVRRGAIDFDTQETQIVCDDSGHIERIIPRSRNDAHRVVEEAMLAANVCSADFIQQANHPCLFRVHEGPTPEKRESLNNYLKAIGLPLSINEVPRTVDFQVIAEATRDRPDASQIHSLLLRSMQQATYTPVNAGHFGLAYEAYTHFTSPIRRYPDLLVHRVIKSILAKEHYQLPALPTPGEEHVKLARKLEKNQSKRQELGQTARGKMNAETVAWQAAGLHCSANERRADEASRDVENWLKCRFMKEHLGEEYGGLVTSATSFGIFVTLDELYVEGLVHITELGGEYFQFDEAKQELRGERTGQRYGIGSRVRVQVSRVDLDGRKIDFRLVHEGAPSLWSSPRGRGNFRVASESMGPQALDYRASKSSSKKTSASRDGAAKKAKAPAKSAPRSKTRRATASKSRR